LLEGRELVAHYIDDRHQPIMLAGVDGVKAEPAVVSRETPRGAPAGDGASRVRHPWRAMVTVSRETSLRCL
jgi:hypothetical protein